MTATWKKGLSKGGAEACERGEKPLEHFGKPDIMELAFKLRDIGIYVAWGRVTVRGLTDWLRSYGYAGYHHRTKNNTVYSIAFYSLDIGIENCLCNPKRFNVLVNKRKKRQKLKEEKNDGK